MCIWNKVLVGLIGVASAVLLFLAMWTLKTHQYWSDLAEKHEQRIKQLSDQNESLVPSIRQLRLDLDKRLLDRRRAWFHCIPKIKRGDGTAEVMLTIDKPSPHGIAAKTVLYAFDETDAQKKGQYLGEFAAAGVSGKQVTLKPTGKLSNRELDRLVKATRPWVLYEIMPRDNRNLFTGLSDDQKRSLFPADVLPEYLKDGKEAAPDDPTDRVVAGKFVRPVWDYGALFRSERDYRILLTDSIAAAKSDKQLIDEALAEARTQEEAGKKDVAATAEDLKGAARQQEVVTDYNKKLEEKLAAIQAMVAQLIATNQAMAGQIAKFQLEAARRIDQRTRAMAQSGAERR
jgi:hypothetical protein